MMDSAVPYRFFHEKLENNADFLSNITEAGFQCFKGLFILVNEEKAAQIMHRVKESLRSSDGLLFTTRGSSSEPATASGFRPPPSPAHSVASSADWEAPSPLHPSLVADRNAFGSEPRVLVADHTPMSQTPGGGTGSASHISVTPLPTPAGLKHGEAGQCTHGQFSMQYDRDNLPSRKSSNRLDFHQAWCFTGQIHAYPL